MEIPDAKVSPKELALAKQLIDSITSKAFDPTEYKDDVQERIEAQIQKKVEGEEITVPEGAAAPASAKVIDIMDALRASLNRKGGNGAANQHVGCCQRIGRTQGRQAAGGKESSEEVGQEDPPAARCAKPRKLDQQFGLRVSCLVGPGAACRRHVQH